MKNARILLLLPVLLALVLTAFRLRPTDERKREVRELAAFGEIELAGGSRVVFTQGSPQRVEVEGSAEGVARTETAVKNGRLRLANRSEGDNRSYREKEADRTVVYITAPTIKGMMLSGSGQFEVKGPLKTEALSLSLSGSGGIRIPELTASSLSSAISGSGNLTLSGSAPRHDLTLSGSGNVVAKGLRTETTNVTVSGSGNVGITATVAANATLRGSGNVRVAGGAKLTSVVKGSGHVQAD